MVVEAAVGKVTWFFLPTDFISTILFSSLNII
jgi:hypothetical protein